jgi:hypothetical protein
MATGIEIIEADDVFAPRQQGLTQMRADEARAPVTRTIPMRHSPSACRGAPGPRRLFGKSKGTIHPRCRPGRDCVARAVTLRLAHGQR